MTETCYRCVEPAVCFVGLADPDSTQFPACALHARSYQHLMMLLDPTFGVFNEEPDENKRIGKARKVADEWAARDIAEGWEPKVSEPPD